MGGISPIQFFIIPFIFLFALPLAIFAGITTALAFLVLYLRLTIAYFDVGLDTIRFLILGNGAYNRRRQLESLGGTASPTPLSSRGGSSPRASSPGTPASWQYRYGRKGRRGSASSGSLTPIASAAGISGGIPLIAPSAGFDRDFEGIGGWRLDSARSHARADDGGDDDDDAQWYTLNSRLELPDRRHHVRSQSGGAVLSGANGVGLYSMASGRAGSVSPGALRMTASPNSSRSRTPTSSRPFAAAAGLSKFDHDEYFPLQDKKHMKKLSA